MTAADYKLLEDALRASDASKRLLRMVGGAPSRPPAHPAKAARPMPKSVATEKNTTASGEQYKDSGVMQDSSSLVSSVTVVGGNNRVGHLQREALKQNIALHILPSGMQKRDGNSSFYHFKSKRICWHVQFVFPLVRNLSGDEIASQLETNCFKLATGGG